jgi:hypothetical protein
MIQPITFHSDRQRTPSIVITTPTLGLSTVH